MGEWVLLKGCWKWLGGEGWTGVEKDAVEKGLCGTAGRSISELVGLGACETGSATD